ncbi:MAG: radical SAM protein, partial [Bacteroidota bacterium]
MNAATSLATIIEDKSLSADLRQIADKVTRGERITEAEGLVLFETGELSYLGALANYLREQRHGDRTYFNRNFHVEPTNVCLYTCTFCSYSRLIKKRDEGWEYSLDEIMDLIHKYDDQPVTEVHIVGGVMPQYNLRFYQDLFGAIKAHRPDLHIKALTPVEYHYIFKKGN